MTEVWSSDNETLNGTHAVIPNNNLALDDDEDEMGDVANHHEPKSAADVTLLDQTAPSIPQVDNIYSTNDEPSSTVSEELTPQLQEDAVAASDVASDPDIENQTEGEEDDDGDFGEFSGVDHIAAQRDKPLMTSIGVDHEVQHDEEIVPDEPSSPMAEEVGYAEDLQKPIDDGDDGFGDFDSAPEETSPAVIENDTSSVPQLDSAPAPVVIPPSHVDDEDDDDFGDFDGATAGKSEIVGMQADERGDALDTGAEQATTDDDDDDDFGDFDSAPAASDSGVAAQSDGFGDFSSFPEEQQHRPTQPGNDFRRGSLLSNEQVVQRAQIVFQRLFAGKIPTEPDFLDHDEPKPVSIGSVVVSFDCRLHVSNCPVISRQESVTTSLD